MKYSNEDSVSDSSNVDKPTQTKGTGAKIREEMIGKMSNDSLMAANLIFILTMRNDSDFSKGDAVLAITRLCKVMGNLDSMGFFDKFDEMDVESAKAIIARAVMINDLSADDVVGWYQAGANAVAKPNPYVGSVAINELTVTTLCRAMSKFSDFAYGLVIYSDISLDKYDEIIDNSNKIFVEFILRASLKLKSMRKNNGNVSSILFFSMLEDVLSSTLNPLIEAISNDAVLRKQFVNNSHVTLQTIRVHLNKKFNNTMLLADELLQLSN